MLPKVCLNVTLLLTCRVYYVNACLSVWLIYVFVVADADAVYLYVY